MRRVSAWLEEVKRDLETPDLWAELQREAKLLGAGSNAVTENTPFTPEEQKEIARETKELAKYVRKIHLLSPAQMQVLDEKLEYLVDASDRLGRKDWFEHLYWSDPWLHPLGGASARVCTYHLSDLPSGHRSSLP